MTTYRNRLFAVLALMMALMLTACDTGPAREQVQISVIYAPEFKEINPGQADLLPVVIAEFNAAYAEGRNPVTGQPLAEGDKAIVVTGRDGSSGTVMQGIVNAALNFNNQNVERPTLFIPSVSHWLALANLQSGRQLFDLANTRASAYAPVVMAIWESRLRAIQDTLGVEEVGWEELLMVLNSPNGWRDFGLTNARPTVFYGHTDPFISSTALSTLISEFYAAAQANGYDITQPLTLDVVRDPAVQDGVRDIEQLIRHYSQRTTEFRNYISQGPEYLDFVALEENDLLAINLGKTPYQPPERLVALYPKEGTFWHEHPMAIVNADWVTPEQREAARVFTDYLLTESVQRRFMEAGFRPANPNIALDYPFVPENGVTVEGPTRVLDVPAPQVIAEIQQSWAYVKKQADVLLVVDISGSMEEDDKIDQAREAAQAFIEAIGTENRVGLMVFSDEVRTVVPMGQLETNKADLINAVSRLRTEGGTSLYWALEQAIALMNETEDEDRIRAIVVLSDGRDNSNQDESRANDVTLNEVTAAVLATRESRNPIIIIPVAYGSDADTQSLNAIARASATQVTSGDPGNILNVLNIISSYF
ncbi:MAG: VWA domain-containing protein [Anaerolineae bacterium]|jgi:Ca-activated chloride channel family protein|nr:VWA domain-containing protein [Anaerolineae bacterium]